MPGKADPSAIPKATARKLAFAAKYVETNNGHEAAAWAGYSAKTARFMVSRLLSDVVVVAEITRLRNVIGRKIESATIANLTEIKERFTRQMRGDEHTADLAQLEAAHDKQKADVAALEATLSDPKIGTEQKASIRSLILRERREALAYDLQLKRLKLDQDAESNKAGFILARMTGALDPSRKPLPNKGDIIERFLLSMVKASSGPDLRAKIRQLKGKTIDITPVPSPPSSPEPES